MGWSSAHHDAMVLAAEAREDLELDGFERVDVFEAIVADGLKLMFRPLREVAGYYEPPRDSAPAEIHVNSDHPLARQRYSAGHEYGHHLFCHGRHVDSGGEPSFERGGRTAEEQRAEAFAAWFLMPPEAAATSLRHLGFDRPGSAAHAYAIALRLGVSFRAICVHLPSLKLATRPVAEEWSDTPLKSVKMGLTLDPPPGGWTNDVWVLGEGDAAGILIVRSGDRVIIDLPDADAAGAPEELPIRELPLRDLLDHRRLCVDVPVDIKPGTQRVTLARPDRELTFSLVVERPRRGRYFPATVPAG